MKVKLSFNRRVTDGQQPSLSCLICEVRRVYTWLCLGLTFDGPQPDRSRVLDVDDNISTVNFETTLTSKSDVEVDKLTFRICL